MYEVKLLLNILLEAETNQIGFRYTVALSKVLTEWLDENCRHEYSSTCEADDNSFVFVVYDFEDEDDAALFKLRFG